jgi:hypothetical protein
MAADKSGWAIVVGVLCIGIGLAEVWGDRGFPVGDGLGREDAFVFEARSIGRNIGWMNLL